MGSGILTHAAAEARKARHNCGGLGDTGCLLWKVHGYHLEMASLQRHENVTAQSCTFFQSHLGVQSVTLIYAMGAVFQMGICSFGLPVIGSVCCNLL